MKLETIRQKIPKYSEIKEYPSFFFFNFWCLFLRERERERAHTSGGETEREGTQNPKQAPGSKLSAQNPTQVSNP